MADHRVLLAPGADTLYPAKIVSRYSAVLNEAGYSLSGSTVCVIGYGGSLGIGLYLLEAGAKRVILQDPFAPRRTRQDSRLNPDLLSKYCRRLGETWIPDKERIELFHGPLECLASRSPSCCDYVLSNSVLEHVRNISSLVEACWTISRNDGTNVHVVDLRDHVFEFPFEMLCYSERVWTRWLNASNHLNRLRWLDYQAVWSRYFLSTTIRALYSLPEEFQQVRRRIRSEFLSGRDDIDSAGIILIVARR